MWKRTSIAGHCQPGSYRFEAHRTEFVMKNIEPVKTHFALIPVDYKSVATSRHLHIKVLKGFR